MRRVSSPNAASAPLFSLVQKSFLAVAFVAFAGSVAWRVWSHKQGGGTIGATPDHAAAFVGGPSNAPAQHVEGLERYLPHVTEAAMFGFIGFALGYASRKVFRIALIFVALAFIAVQILVSTGHVSIDWLGVNSKLNEWIFNVKQNESVTGFLTQRIPSAAALLAGCVLGFKRG